MLKRIFGLLVLGALIATPVMAQSGAEGRMFVVVLDESENPIEGAEVSLKGADFTRTRTTDADGQVRFINLAPGAYELEIGADGFNRQIYPNIRVESLQNVQFPVKLQKGQITEQIVVTSQSPLLDNRKVGTATVLTQEEITQVPQARDPWAVLQTIPGVSTDRVNVGGSEAGQQSNYVGQGDNGSQSSWVLDGVEFTDPAAEGSSSSYLDFNAFEEISFVSGGADFEQTTPGLRLNFVQKQGSNQTTGTGRFIYTENDLQDNTSDNPSNPLPVDAGQTPLNTTTRIFEKNFDLGGPWVKDKVWYWFGFTENEIDLIQGSNGLADETTLRNISGKVHGQVGGDTTWRAFITEGDKIKLGRLSAVNRSADTAWNQDGPTPIYSAEISHFFNPNFELSAQYARNEGGFRLIPEAGDAPGTQVILGSSGNWESTFFQFDIDRPVTQYAVRGNYFFEGGSWDHELKFGVKVRELDRRTLSVYGGDDIFAIVDNFAAVARQGNLADEVEGTYLWAGNTMLKGPWAISYGLNFVQQEGSQLGETLPASTLFPTELPALTTFNRDAPFEWEDILPRVGATYTFGGEKRILLRGSYSQYVDNLASGDVSFNNAAGASYIAYAWDDTGGNGDERVQPGEVDIAGGPLFSANVDPNNPAAPANPNQIDPDLEAPRVDEFIVGAEYEFQPNMTLSGSVTLRERDRDLWAPLFDVTQFNANGSLVTIPASSYDCQPFTDADTNSPDVAFTEEVCALNATGVAATTTARPVYLTNRPGYTQEFTGFEVAFNKRLSNRWMLRSYIQFNDWQQQFDGVPTSSDRDQAPNSGFGVPDGDPTNLVGGGAVDGGDVVFQSGGSGPKGDVWLGSSNWSFNVNGLYQLPKDITVSANIFAREGYAIPAFATAAIAEGDGITQNRQVQVGSLDQFEYDDLFITDLKVSKLLKLSGGTTVEIAGELFNAFDEDTVLSVCRDVASGQCNFGNINEAVNPRIIRFSATINY